MQKRKGISLIVLVITIIVMAILAGAIILTLNNSGIFEKASGAVEATNKAQVNQIAQVGWAAAYVDGARTETELRAGVISELEKNNIEPEDYGMIVTTSGVAIQKGWLKDGFTLVKGNQVLEIGDSIAYDETAGGTKTGLTATDWKVLGADEKGNLLIMSTANVVSLHRLGYESTMTDGAEKLAESQKDWLNGATELDTICKLYGNGVGALGARSITIDDINKLTGYDPETALYGKGEVYQYGNKVTYSYNGTTKPAYTSSVANGALTVEHNDGFFYYNGEEPIRIIDLTKGASGNVLTTITNTFYNYSASNLTTISKTDNAKVYSMMFGNNDSKYWLASPYVVAGTNYIQFGMRRIYNGFVMPGYLWYSNGSSVTSENGVRAVVTLSADIQLTGNSTNGWSY